ncbi:CAD87-like protein [Mya arenaria]|uniref:CAD87-like protein n=1 Tax=Mya arenaria TaxID=6604 RepID=A0ABY7DJ79_MYAAR|nr:CAD87-like protein [Mya arenaria]
MHVFGAFVFLTFHTLVASQDVIWIRDMDKFEINEGTDGSVYTLLANYQGRSDNIIYGFNAKTGDDVSLSVDNDYFQINEQTGEVFVKSKLDYEAASQKQGIKMRMVAKVRGDDTKYSRQESTVIVVNINDEKPVFINGSLSVTLRENEVITDPNGRLLIENLIVRDVDNLMTPPRRYPEAIVIGCSSNVSQLNARILARDQDISTEGGLRSIEYKFLPEPAFIQNDIEIDLENPTFRDFNTGEVRNEWPLEIEACEIISSGPPLVVGTTRTECTDIGTVTILIVDVNDNGPKFENPSYERFAIFTSHFVSPSAEFDLIGINTSSPIIIVKNTSLIDYEIGPQRYDLQIKTYDIQNPALFMIVPVTIHILDVNDNYPTFDRLNYTETIPENSQEGTNVVRIQARDIDSLQLGTAGLRYYLRESPYSPLFDIDEITGQLIVAKCTAGKHGQYPCLDYDIPPRTYTLSVSAVDSLGLGWSKAIDVFVRVTDVNDNPPTVIDYTRSIFENSVRFDPPLEVQGNDIDTNSRLSYSIQTQAPNSFWAIDPNTGEIFVNKPNGAGIKFDDGQTGLGRFLLDVAVTDGLSILQLLATDKDDPSSENGILEYKISTGSLGQFRVDINTGKLYTTDTAVLDYDNNNRYEMQVRVSDKGKPRLTALATVIVNILNVNNKDPYIDPFLQNFVVYDNAFIGQKIGTIRAYDQDADAQFNFTFNDQKEATSDQGYVVDYNVYDFRNLFIIDQKNGSILVNGKLNSRITNIVTYGVTVQDVTPKPPQTGLGQAFIRIKPFNTQPPEFENFTSPIYIDEEQPIGSVIVSLIARDNNGIEEFKIIEQPDDFFTVNPNTGAVSVISRVDYDDVRMINDSYLIVQVLDTGEPKLSATASLSVIFRNINDNFPNFLRRSTNTPVNVYNAEIFENAAFNTTVTTVYAEDRDRPDANGYHTVRYFMNDDRFSVDQFTGRIYVNLTNGAVLDRELNPLIRTQVIARDNPQNNPLGLPGNQRQRAAIIFETIGVETDILQLFSTDADIGNYSISFYSKVPGVGTDYNDYFDVRRESGRIYVKRSLLRHVGFYEFLVQATDDLGRGFKANATIYVEVKPSANSPPIWIIPPVDNMTIYVLELLLKASDRGETPLETTRFLTVIIKDVNDNKPLFIKDEEEFRVQESANVGYPIGQVQAFDDDENPEIFYDIISGNEEGKFFLGRVSTRAPLNKQIMTVQAIDRDAVGSGVVRYRLVGSNHIANINGQDKFLFYIHPKFGIMTNKVLMNQYAGQTFEVQVNARDGESIEESEDANTTALVFVTQPANEVKLLIGQNTGEVRLYQTQIQRSDVYVSGIRYDPLTKRYTILSTTEFSNIIQRERTSRSSDFDLLYIKEVAEFSSSQEIELEDSAVLIIMIIIAVLIFLIIVFCIVAFLCIRASKRQKKAMLLHKTHATPAPIPVVMAAVEPEPVIYDNRGFSQEEPVFVQQVEEKRVIETDPVHVQYAVVSKRSSSPERMEYDDDTDAIVTEIRDDDVPAQSAVYEPEYRIETEVVSEKF